MNNSSNDFTKKLHYFNYMIEQVFKKPNRKGCPTYKGAEKYKYFSAPYLDAYFPERKNVYKNYILSGLLRDV